MHLYWNFLVSAKFIFWNISLEQYEQFKIFLDFGLPFLLEPILITGNLKLGASIIPHDELPINILHFASNNLPSKIPVDKEIINIKNSTQNY